MVAGLFLELSSSRIASAAPVQVVDSIQAT